MKLDLSSLKLAVQQLQISLDYCASELARKDTGIRAQFNSAAIQAFEYTYELSWKMLKRYLAQTAATPAELDELSFPNLIRLGSTKGVLRSGWDQWKIFRDQRNITTHTYDQNKVTEVLAILPDFLQEATFLLHELENRETSW